MSLDLRISQNRAKRNCPNLSTLSAVTRSMIGVVDHRKEGSLGTEESYTRNNYLLLSACHI